MHIPGAGVGGHCLPKDPWLLVYGLNTYGDNKFAPEVITNSRKVNDSMPMHMKTLLLDALQERNIMPADARAAILGYAFLENSDDPRNTPALPLYRLLVNELKEVTIHDPYVAEDDDAPISSSLDETLEGRDCILLVTRHREYCDLSLDALKEKMRTPIIIDGRNVWSRSEAISKGFTFRGVGLPR
jgi:UDP-N-acetyl-D-mannosaminuronic acid dehydrogenase